jgi:hypothetical protein
MTECACCGRTVGISGGILTDDDTRLCTPCARFQAEVDTDG